MSPTVEPFERLEEFSPFSSCIKCFGRPIIPPLLTPSRRHELQQLRAAAVDKEAELLKRRKGHAQKKDSQISSKTKPSSSDIQSNVNESCALWYPSSKDYHKGISVAISKFPTSGIYSSVHTGAIVCSDVIENSHQYAPRIASDSLFGSRASTVHCVECSHSNINLDCSLCQAEYDQNFHNTSFASDVSPEVPCRTFSLQHPNRNVVNEELNSTVDENECDSLPTVICSQKFVGLDTDSESNATCMTQSTDLEKYMELSCEYGSPDNSAAAWDCKSFSQQFTLSRSDDASSETIVNTENELTPCASTMAEFTDNIEDELSNADETANISENRTTSAPVTLKRAHSVDSYMKIIQSCARNMHVKKSSSEPFNTTLKTSSTAADEFKISSSSQTSHLIKEDSKESEDSNEMPEKDNSVSYGADFSASNEQIPVSGVNQNDSFQRKHIRQNSYTLDHPSSALIRAHADCTCNFDANCISPHCSALTDQNALAFNSAFTREKVTDIPVSFQQGKKFPILTPENSDNILSKEELTSSVVDIFPLVKEDSVEKSNSGNANVTEEEQAHETVSSLENGADLKLEGEEQLHKRSSETLNICDNNIDQEYLKRIYKELQENHEIRVKELFEEQNRQWLKLQEEFKEQEQRLYVKLNLPVVSSTDALSRVQQANQMEDQDCPSKDVLEVSPNQEEEKKSSSSNVSTSFSDQICTSDNTVSLQNHNLEVPNSSSEYLSSPSKINSFLENPRASLTPSSESKTPHTSPSTSLGVITQTQLPNDYDSSVECNCDYNEDHLLLSNRESLHNINGFVSKNAFLLPHINDIPTSCNTELSSDSKFDTSSTCFCDKSPTQCRCCSSYNGFDEYDSHLEYFSMTAEKSCSPHVIDLNSQVEHTLPRNSSSDSSVKHKNLNSLGDHFTLSSKMKRSDTALQKENNSICANESKSASSQTSIEMPSSFNNKSCEVSQQSVKEKNRFLIDTIVSSVYAKTLRNGSIPSLSVSSNRPIVIDPVILEKFAKLPAFVKGYLTRRLFKTEKVQNLIKTLQDTALLIGKLSEDLSMKGDSVSERDVDFHRQLIVQLMTTFHSVYDIFCTISTKERMDIIAESRNHKIRQKFLEEKQDSNTPVTSKAPVPDPSKKPKLSSATLKALERKRRSTIDSRTYTIEDFKSFRSRSVIDNRTYTIEEFKNRPGRSRSSMLSKSHSVSPSAIYKASVGLSPKRKTASSKTPGSRRCLHMKWVP